MAACIATFHILGMNTGKWCPSCLLPSAAEAVYVLSTNGGPSHGVHNVTVCHDCGWRDG